MNKERQQLDIDFRIHWETGWHVGSGYSSSLADRMLRRRARGQEPAFVPGSQIKGVLRHHCERLAAALTCAVVSPHVLGADLNAEVVTNFKPLPKSDLVIDRLFGSRYQGECLFVDDALPVAETTGSESWLHSRTSMDRVSGAAKEKTLFVTEVAEHFDLEMQGRIAARHPIGSLTQEEDRFPYEYALLLAGLLSIESFGGNKSAGLGRCRINIVKGKVLWKGKDLSVEEALTNFHEEAWKEMLDLIREEAAS